MKWDVRVYSSLPLCAAKQHLGRGYIEAENGMTEVGRSAAAEES